MQVVRHAHQALTKPCRLGELEAALTSACKLRELVTDDEVRRILGRVELPQLPKTYQRLVQVLEDPRTGPQQIADVLSSDIAVSAKILRLANSAIFGGRRQVTSVAQGIAVIGTETIKGLVLADAVAKKAQIPALIQKLVEDVQEHSLLVARVAAEVAGADPVARRDAFSAGMLHDVGRLVLALEMPDIVDSRTAVMRRPDAFPGTTTVAGTMSAHARIGGYLLGLWGLPLGVIEAVVHHHDAVVPESSVVAASIKVAEDIIAEVAADEDRASAEEVEIIMKLAGERGRELAKARNVVAA
jgi:HD-like signal output (HDOD) protein